ncbi:MAG: hypothetical protein ONB44_22545 [candidate division KSB1 bacterium]|nr:hypothetical protein [candidate division KSB1 bacterium]MDZ7304918.1 hypothetical protein [candidate division KSB1 bacterium]MDZ7313946.1 hypothetical protein [candidate division KSB1 bacterium]
MIQTVQAVIDKNGQVRLLENVQLSKPRRALVTILDEEVFDEIPNITALLSESALATDWNRPEEDEAWAHLQQVR